MRQLPRGLSTDEAALWQRLAASAGKGTEAFVDAGACRAYAAAARSALAIRLDSEKP